MCFDPCFGSSDFKYLFLALLDLFKMYETLPLILYSKNKYMSASEISSGSSFVILSIAPQLKVGALK